MQALKKLNWKRRHVCRIIVNCIPLIMIQLPWDWDLSHKKSKSTRPCLNIVKKHFPARFDLPLRGLLWYQIKQRTYLYHAEAAAIPYWDRSIFAGAYSLGGTTGTKSQSYTKRDRTLHRYEGSVLFVSLFKLQLVRSPLQVTEWNKSRKDTFTQRNKTQIQKEWHTDIEG